MKLSDIKILKRMTLPDGSMVIVANVGSIAPPEVRSEEQRLEFDNRNVFRFAPDGSLIWQVRRDEQGRYDYEANRRAALDGGIHDMPLNSFLWIDPDELHRQEVPCPLTRPMVPGMKLRVGGYVHIMPHGHPFQMDYELDIDTGLALNISPLGPRRSW
jgi:hypothetical protein